MLGLNRSIVSDDPTERVALTRSESRGWLALTSLLCLVGINLRSILLSVSPALPAIRNDFHLNFTETGALTALPIAVMGLAALPGAMLVGRFGARSVIGIATLGLAVCSAMRLAPPEPVGLYFWTAAFAACIAIAQPAVAVATRSWFPATIQSATTAYSAALNLGAVAGATLSVYTIAALGWRVTFALWSLIAAAAGLVWWALAPPASPQSARASRLRLAIQDPLLWRAGLILGAQTMVYYGSTTWIPFQLRSADHAYVSVVLFLVTGTTIPVGIGLAAFKQPWAVSPVFYIATGAIALTASLGFILTSNGLAWVWAILLGVALGMGFSGGMSLPNLLVPERSQVAIYTAFALTVAYIVGFIGPLLGGFVVDRTGLLSAPFWFTAAAGATVATVGGTLNNARVAAPSAAPRH